MPRPLQRGRMKGIMRLQREIKRNQRAKSKLREREIRFRMSMHQQGLINLDQHKRFRYQVLIRDNFTCRVCGSRINLTVHHIKSISLYPELRYKISNGVTVCRQCHDEIEYWKERRYEENHRNPHFNASVFSALVCF
jgi:5-methylcytosine-specific restriction endonuclease McrA